MKGKAATYLLGAVVAIVWGLIIYRLVDAYSGKEEEPVSSAPIPRLSKEPLNDYSAIIDTTHLMLNYRDPFGTDKAKDTVRTRPVRQVISEAVKQAASVKLIKPAINWGFISYTGYIRNPTSKKLLALVHINGRELMMSEGESAEQVKLLKNLRDSIQVAYQGKTKYIIMNTASL